MPERRRDLLRATAASTILATASTAMPSAPRAQPIAGGRPVRIIVPFPPGGAVDIQGRLLADRLGPAIGGGQTVVVENRSGAGGMLGADAVAKAAPDGTTIGLIGVTTLCAAQYLYSRLPFDPAKDLAPVTQISTGALLCVVNADTASRNRWADFRALVAWSKAHPDQVRMGSSGTGTTSHLNIEAINRFAGARILHVPYRGGGPAINDLLAGTIDMMFDVMPALMPHVESGKFKALAVSSAQRLDILPEVPSMRDFADLGLGEMDVQTWNAIMTAPGTPEPVVARLAQAVKAVAAQPEFVQRMRPIGYQTVVSESPAALAAKIEAERPRWQRLVEISGARLD
jgi:tripartite-type tricarboxylate transporter receptor subunit TctC